MTEPSRRPELTFLNMRPCATLHTYEAHPVSTELWTRPWATVVSRRDVVCALPLELTNKRSEGKGGLMKTKKREVVAHLGVPSTQASEELPKEMACKLKMDE